MNQEELKQEILNNLSKDKRYVKPKFRNDHNLTSKQCFDILYPEEIKRCKYCGNESEFDSFSSGYKDICDSKECKHKHRIETLNNTNLEKYGVKFISQKPEIKEKIKNTLFERYGVYDFLNSEQNRHNMYDENGVHKARSKETNEKRKQTLLERYGTTDNFKINNGREKSNSKEGREKSKQTLLKNYGVTSTWELQKTKETIKKTNLEKYGETCYLKTDEFKEKLKNHNLEKYGVEYYFNSDDYKIKSKTTSLKKYNSEYYLSSELRKQREIESSHWISDEDRTEYELYCLNVWRITNKQDLESLKDFDKRGRIDLNPDAYHIDHKFSIREGFEENIPPEIIGSLKNLEMIPGRKNCSKNSKCSITKEELLNDPS